MQSTMINKARSKPCCLVRCAVGDVEDSSCDAPLRPTPAQAQSQAQAQTQTQARKVSRGVCVRVCGEGANQTEMPLRT